MRETISVAEWRASAEMKEILAEIEAMSPEQREADQASCFGTIGNCIFRLAAHVTVAEREPMKIDDMRKRFGNTFVDHLRLVACGMLYPQLFHRFYVRPSLLSRASALPLPEQKRLAEGGTVPVLVLDDQGKPDLRRKDPLTLSREELMRVFDGNHIRDQAEQVRWIDDMRMRSAAPVAESVGRVRIDADRIIATFPKGGDYTLEELSRVVRSLQRAARRQKV